MISWNRPQTKCYFGKYQVKWTYNVIWNQDLNLNNSIEIASSGTDLNLTDVPPYSDVTIEVSTFHNGKPVGKFSKCNLQTSEQGIKITCCFITKKIPIFHLN